MAQPTDDAAADDATNASTITGDNFKGALDVITPGVVEQAKVLPGNEPIHLPNIAPGAVEVGGINNHPLIYDGQLPKPTNDAYTEAAIPQPLDQAYAQNAQARETAALDQEAANAHALAAAMGASGSTGGNLPQSIAGDVAQGVGIEGARSAVLGAKSAVNENLSGDYEQTNDLDHWVANHVSPYAVPFVDGSLNPLAAGQKALAVAGQTFDGKTGAAKIDELQKLMFGGATLEAPQLPVTDAEQPKTVTGNVIKNVSQFATGMLGGGKVTEGWKGAILGGKLLKGLASGAIADFSSFDGHQQRLSNLLATHGPAITKPIFDFLAADDHDPQLVARAKAAVEGMGLGALGDGLFNAVKGLAVARRVKLLAQAAHAREGGQVPIDLPAGAAESAGEKIKAEVEDALAGKSSEAAAAETAAAEAKGLKKFAGKVAKAMGVTGKQPASIAHDITHADVPPNPFDIDFNHIETPDDIKGVISTMSDRFAHDIEGARRGLQTWEQTSAEAGAHDWVQSMGKRGVGQAMNASEILAYRQVLNASAAKLLDLAKAVSENPTLANQYAFRKMLATHHAIQSEFMGARAEAGRALNAFKIPAGTPARYLRQIDEQLGNLGGANTAKELADKVLKAANAGDIVLNQMIRGGWAARGQALVRLVYTNSLLTGIGTAIINVAGNTSAALMNLSARAVAPRLAQSFGGVSTTEVGEALAMMHGYINGAKDAFRMGAKDMSANGVGGTFADMKEKGLFRGALPGIDSAMPEGISLHGPQREEAGANVGRDAMGKPLSAAAWRVDEDTALGRVLDVTQMLVESPSNFHLASDDFFKMLTARAELHAQAFRQTAAEAKAGLLHSDTAVKLRMQDLVDNPTDAMLNAAEEEMRNLTFTRKTPGIADRFSALRRALDNNPTPIPFGSLILPFLRTPANLISMAMNYSPLAPFMRRFREDVMAGGARAEVAKAKMAIGSALWSYWIGLANDGHLTGDGPTNRAERDALMRTDEYGGSLWQPHSIRIGERWWSYNRLDPLGTTMSLAASAGELLSNNDWDNANRATFDQIQGHIIAALGQAFFDKTMLKDSMDFTEAVAGGDQNKAARWFRQFVSSALPGSSGLRMLRRGVDPYMRDVQSTLDAMKNTVPLLSQGLPVQRDLWGKPRTYQTGLGTVYDSVLPVQTEKAGGSAIDLEILNNGVSVSMPSRSLTVEGENVSLQTRPDIYSDFVKQAGEPAFAKLNAVAQGRDPDSSFYFGLSDGPTGGKAIYIKDIMRAYRAQARAEIIEKYAADLQSMAADARRRRENARGNTWGDQ